MAKSQQKLSWLEYRAAKTGKTVEELRADMSSRGKLGGHPTGVRFTEQHRQRLSKARRQRDGSKPRAT